MRLEPGQRVLIGDGVGRPSALSAELSAAARDAGGIRLLLGWNPVRDDALELDAFAEVRTLMGGWGLRKDIDAGRIAMTAPKERAPLSDRIARFFGIGA